MGIICAAEHDDILCRRKFTTLPQHLEGAGRPIEEAGMPTEGAVSTSEGAGMPAEGAVSTPGGAGMPPERAVSAGVGGPSEATEGPWRDQSGLRKEQSERSIMELNKFRTYS